MWVPTIRFDRIHPDEFIDFWSQIYTDPREELYGDSIARPLTPEKVRNLYLWKNNGQRLAEPKKRSVERNVIGRLDELKQLGKDYPPADFLLHLGRVGPIWSIFFLHIWQPDKYPIYDQHTYRAMCFIQHVRIEEIPSNSRLIARTYINDYIPFFSNRFPQVPDRKVDKALFAFGKFLKTPLGRRLAMADGRQGA